MSQSRRANSTLGLVPLLLATSTVLSWAQTPASDSASTTRLVPISGTLTDAQGAPVTGSVTVTLSLYDAQEQGTLLWTETQQVQANARGQYSAYLGALGAVPPEIFRGEQARWLGVEVSGRELPRTMLVAVPYALHAADAEALGGQPASSFVRSRADGKLETNAGVIVAEPLVDGSGVAGQITKWAASDFLSSSTITETASNRVGFGLTDPTGGGVVDSVFTIRNFDNNTGFGILNQTQQRRFAINTLASGGWTIYDGGSGGWLPGLSQVAGRVGLVNPAPAEALHVGSATALGAVRIDSAFNAATGPKVRWTENAGASFNGFEAEYRPDANDRFIIRSMVASAVSVDNILVLDRSTGFVGMGIEPLDRLHAAGDIRVGTGTTGCVKDADATVLTGVCSSDLRFKKNITPFGRALEKVAALQPVNFYWRADEYADKHFGTSETFGLIAQDVEKVLPELVTADDQGYKAVRYNALPFHMLQAIKDLKAENDELKQRLEQQEARLRRLEGQQAK